MMAFMRFILLTVITTPLLLLGTFAVAEEGYGLDCSWPIQNFESSCGDLLGDRKAVYDEYMRGCREKWGAKGAVRCSSGDEDRLEMSRRQPQSMVVRDTQ
jgi:hypothetical protein